MGFANDPDYAPFGKARQEGSNSRFQLIDDTDVAGTVPYLGKGRVVNGQDYLTHLANNIFDPPTL